MSDKKFTNKLAEASSPYLLQHAHNPVDWLPWGPEALAKAKHEDKPIIVSIGYSACHWCHVMERESFENEDIAAIMNAHFVCIKVDREERPDLDQVYMEAVHAMGLQGGWPLNVFLLPDQRPFYGGTYFPPKGWAQLCNQIGRVFKEQRAELEKSAEGFMRSLGQAEAEKYGLTANDRKFTKAQLNQMFAKHAENFDLVKGGNNRAPKFPMPSVYRFLLFEGHLNNNEQATNHALNTLNQMAWGGIYDQIGGGFTRYSTDMDWFVPHFEKMLYDNGQLVTLYCEAYQKTQNPLYKNTIYQTIDWLARELTDKSGGFYSALDADSEGEEGKFYLWTMEEFEQILGPDAELLIEYYNLTAGNWEPGKNIPYRAISDEEFAKIHQLDLEELDDIVQSGHIRLMAVRDQRVRPGLDDKILAGWNGLMLKGLCDAYALFSEEKFITLARSNAHFLCEQMISDDGQLFRTHKNGKSTIDGYLEDYTSVIQGLTALYQITFDIHWLHIAEKLTEIAVDQFYDNADGFFFFTSSKSEKLIARKKEIFDNVIPSSNAMMAEALLDLGILLDKEVWVEMAKDMTNRMDRILNLAPQDVSNWSRVAGRLTYPTAEIVIVAHNPQEEAQKLAKHYMPNKVVAGMKPDEKASLPLLEGRTAIDGQPTFYLCYNKACQLPVNSIDALIEQIRLSESQ
ncbi:thioredoxin domain-containing protein [Roseivirga pacifica]|uniref:thioredoxin domain-containing protein n=1 Tax=Roseivirga pacifica TaxID=1267423 RepID=UPI003BAC0C7A